MADSPTSIDTAGPTRAPAANLRAPRGAGVHAPGVSVIVCTYNRLPFLRKLAESIETQLPVAYPLEILIVDNNCTDGTAAFARELAAGNGAFRYLLEPKQGLSHARNAGAAAASHGFLMYLDDDAVLPPHYLPTLGRLVAEHDPDFLGGPLYPLYLDPKPAWFPESLEVRKKTERSGFDQDVTLTGANYGVKKSVLQKVGGFDPRYGMTGKKVGMLEERLVIETYRRITPPEEQKVYYSLETFILNATPARRMRVGFQLKRIFLGNAGYVHWRLSQGIRSPRLLLKRVWRAFRGELSGWLRQVPALWRARSSDPERPMLALVKLTYRGADLWGALEFFLTDFGRTRRRRLAEPPEPRPLRATLFTSGSETTPDVRDLKAALEGEAILDVVPIGESSDDRIRQLARQVNLRAQDLILTDSLKAARALAVLRGPQPHLQLLLWLRDPKPLNYLKTARHFWEKRKEALGRLGRDRALVREVDQVVCAAAWLTGPLARTLLPLPGAVTVPPFRTGKGGEGPPRGEAIEAWRGVLGQARPFAPRRLSP